jgi:hypothetical protein
MKSFWNQNNRIPNLKEQALEIKNELNSGLNSVNIEIENGLIRYDLDGKAHGAIQTPHKHFYQKNKVNGVVKSLSKMDKNPEEMNQQDIRTVRKFKENEKN